MVVSRRAADAVLDFHAVGDSGVGTDVEAETACSNGWQRQQQLKRDDAPEERTCAHVSVYPTSPAVGMSSPPLGGRRCVLDAVAGRSAACLSSSLY